MGPSQRNRQVDGGVVERRSERAFSFPLAGGYREPEALHCLEVGVETREP